uniref:Uncharacterized protein n=1 Tax=Pseudonaja textilis TaxID=8673 RepID=A0A670XRP5_PSETE
KKGWVGGQRKADAVAVAADLGQRGCGKCGRPDLCILGKIMGIKSGFTLGNLVFFWMLSSVKGKGAGQRDVTPPPLPKKPEEREREVGRRKKGGVCSLNCDRKCNLLAKAGVQCSD